MPGYNQYSYYDPGQVVPPSGTIDPGLVCLWYESAALTILPDLTTGVRDWDVLSDIRDRLIATGAFDGVHLSGLPAEYGRSAGEARMAVCTLSAWDDTDDWDDTEDVSIPRAVAWTLTLFVRQSDPESRDREADRLANVAQNVLDGRSLAGVTLPGLTKIRRGRWERSPAPERRLVLMGEFTYLVNAFDGHDTTE